MDASLWLTRKLKSTTPTRLLTERTRPSRSSHTSELQTCSTANSPCCSTFLTSRMLPLPSGLIISVSSAMPALATVDASLTGDSTTLGFRAAADDRTSVPPVLKLAAPSLDDALTLTLTLVLVLALALIWFRPAEVKQFPGELVGPRQLHERRQGLAREHRVGEQGEGGEDGVLSRLDAGEDLVQGAEPLAVGVGVGGGGGGRPGGVVAAAVAGLPGDGVGDEGEVAHDARGTADDVLVGGARELAADVGLPALPLSVAVEAGQQQQQLAEDAAPLLLHLVGGRAGPLDVAVGLLHGGLDGLGDDAEVVGQEVQRGAEVAPEPAAVRHGRREDGPDEGHGAAGGDAGEAVRGQQVGREVRLARGGGGGLADLLDLQLVADDEHLGDDGDEPDGHEARVLEHEVLLDEDEEPQEHDDAGGALDDDVPDDEKTTATQVPPTRHTKPKMDCPAVMVMPMAIMIMAHTRRCSLKKVCVLRRKAMMPMVMVATATRNPNMDSPDPTKPENRRTALPRCCHAPCAGRCSGSFFLLYPSPAYTMLAPISATSGVCSGDASSVLQTPRNHFLSRFCDGTMSRLRAIVPSATLESAKSTRSCTASPSASMSCSMYSITCVWSRSRIRVSSRLSLRSRRSCSVASCLSRSHVRSISPFLSLKSCTLLASTSANPASPGCAPPFLAPASFSTSTSAAVWVVVLVFVFFCFGLGASSSTMAACSRAWSMASVRISYGSCSCSMISFHTLFSRLFSASVSPAPPPPASTPHPCLSAARRKMSTMVLMPLRGIMMLRSRL
ncbi:uncharacterized protein ColKHC_05219 [Colletotrichum higginsianum]|nr:uncharacterized protein ColKHC_05219 [Colletotrichum higginsianum]